MSARPFLIAALLLAVCANAWPQMRSIPDNAKRGTMSHIADMIVLLNGNRTRLAPGAQIRDQQNYVIVPSALPRGSLVKYITDAGGNVFRVWVLSAEEAARPDRGALPPPRDWQFGTPVERALGQ